jgi:hypothetical protein
MRELQSLAKRTIGSVANDEEGRSRQASIEKLRSDSNVRKDIGYGDHGGVDVGYPWFRECAIKGRGRGGCLVLFSTCAMPEVCPALRQRQRMHVSFSKA